VDFYGGKFNVTVECVSSGLGQALLRMYALSDLYAPWPFN